MKKVLLSFVALVLLITLTACNSEQSGGGNTDNYPEKTLNWTIAFGPGGGNDIMSRTIIDIINQYDLYPNDIVPENREGGSGAVGWGYLNSKKGDPYQISSTSGSFINTPLVSDVPFSHESFTPVALLATDDMVMLVNEDSEFNTLEDFINAAKSGKTLSIGGIGAVNVDMMIPKLLADQADFEFEYVPFQGGGELTSGLLSKSVDAIMANPAETIGQIQGGKMKALAFSGQKRIPQLPDVPTLIESGYEVSLPMPRGVILAGDVPKEVQEWWVETLKVVVEKPEWKKYIEENSLTDYQLFGDEFGSYLAETHHTFEDILLEIGAIEEKK
ncbi:Bug family tripartite tricarboxylate transporter substrate binding protein [Bacillus sp. PS06]|uniref:Bug family tripartite tricarboxylate transporter substrate binding protein n=1 Tax=Bacillus sp. PS06 TaxID=2764176 RepID=UPI00177C6C25|nr:tripartite tricarboxylate transporter substrate binding protein [Bacillus sp. PS06]MBD8067928.1 tripartite tricarboxylate transporter substrate binding protein [Bacillus sp. PS06]